MIIISISFGLMLAGLIGYAFCYLSTIDSSKKEYEKWRQLLDEEGRESDKKLLLIISHVVNIIFVLMILFIIKVCLKI